MKLFYSPTSPFVRKVVACAITRGLDGRIERIPTDAHASPAALLAANPLSKVPALLTEDGVALFDSPLICEYLDSIGDEPPLFPRPWRQPLGGAALPGARRRHHGCRRGGAGRDHAAPRKRHGRPTSSARRRRSPVGWTGAGRSAAVGRPARHRRHLRRLRARLPRLPLCRRCLARSSSAPRPMVQRRLRPARHRHNRPAGLRPLQT